MTARTMSVFVLCAALAAPILAAAEEAPGWDSSLTLGLNLTRGNSKTLSSNGRLATERKDARNEFSFGVEGNYGETEITTNGVKEMDPNIQNARGWANYKRLFTERMYAYANADLANDQIADLDYRLTAGPGMGRYFIKSEIQTWGIEAGVAYIGERLGGVTDDRAALRVAERYELKLGEASKIWEATEYLPALDDFDNYLISSEIGAEAALNARLSLRVVAQEKYNSQPAAGKEKDDLIVTAAVSYKF